MANKGTTLTVQSRYNISASRQSNRTKVLEKLKEYISILLDPKEIDVIPSIVSASLYAGISKKALLAWELTTGEDHELRQILDFIRDMEEVYLRENGLLGKTDSKLTARILEAEHGLGPKPTQLSQTNIFNGMTPELLAEAIEISRSNNKALKPQAIKKTPKP